MYVSSFKWSFIKPIEEIILACTYCRRLYGHNETFNKRKLANKSKLSKYIWFLKDNGVQCTLKWKVVDRAKSFNPVTGVCRLCLMEKYYILFHPEGATLNSRDEIYGFCKHKSKFLLSKAKTWPDSSHTGFLKKQHFSFTQTFVHSGTEQLLYLLFQQHSMESDDCWKAWNNFVTLKINVNLFMINIYCTIAWYLQKLQQMFE